MRLEKEGIMDFFLTLQISTEKAIHLSEVAEDIAKILYKQEYEVFGSIGITEIENKNNKLIKVKDCTEAFNVHYQSIKGAW